MWSLAFGACVLLPSAATPPAVATREAAGSARPTGAWPEAKIATLTGINVARAAAGLPPVAWDATLERVGDAFAATLADERGFGHVASDGVPPYLRALLAGAEGFHRENVGSYDSSVALDGAEVEGIAVALLADMLAEKSPDDGHRRTILEPTATHLGVGVSVRGGALRLTHEVSSRGALSWAPPPLVVRPLAMVSLRGRLARPWQPTGIEVLWEPLPTRRGPDAAPVRTYTYPPVRSMTFDSSPGVSLLGFPRADGSTVLEINDHTFSFAWKVGPAPGVETTVVWARPSAAERTLTPLAAATTVVTSDGTLPGALACWAALREENQKGLPKSGGDGNRR